MSVIVAALASSLAVGQVSALSPQRGPDALERFAIPIRARAIATAQGPATLTCAWWAKACWSSFSPPAGVAGESAPALACAIEETGEVACWGLVDKSLCGPEAVLVRVPELAGSRAVAVGRSNLCGLDAQGALTCLRYAWEVTARAWVLAPPWRAPGSWRSVSAGADKLCAVNTHGAVMCWGAPGSCGNENEGTSPRPVHLRCPGPGDTPQQAVPAGAVSVSSSWLGGCAVQENRKVSCWGENAPNSQNSNDAAVELAQLGNVAEVAASNTHACARRSHGEVYCWPALRGVYASGATTREVVRLATDGPVQAIALGEGLTCWIDAAGTGRCRLRAEPPTVLAEHVAEISIGEQICARTDNADVTCWTQPTRSPPRQGDFLAVASSTLYTGGAYARPAVDGHGAFDLGVRAQLDAGLADREAELTHSLGALADLRACHGRVCELVAGPVATLAPDRAGNPSYALALLAGTRSTASGYEPLVVALGRVSLRHAAEREVHERGHGHYALQIGLYATARYAPHSDRFEVSAGIELDLSLPVLLIEELGYMP